MLFRPRQSESLGLKALVDEMSVYRFLLASLWISVAVIYLLGASDSSYTLTARLLGLINIVLEMISYWAGFTRDARQERSPIGERW